MTRRILSCLLMFAAMSLAGCGNDATSPTTTVSPVTETWASSLAVGGATSRSFTASQAGTASATLSAPDFPLAIGIGVPQPAGGGCRLTVSRSGGAGTAVEIPVVAGSYCVQVYDETGLPDWQAITIQITYP